MRLLQGQEQLESQTTGVLTMIFDGEEVKIGSKKHLFNKNKKVVGTSTVLDIDEHSETITIRSNLIDGTIATMIIHVPTNKLLSSSIVKSRK